MFIFEPELEDVSFSGGSLIPISWQCNSCGHIFIEATEELREHEPALVTMARQACRALASAEHEDAITQLRMLAGEAAMQAAIVQRETEEKGSNQ
jgi:hypothetical protein